MALVVAIVMINPASALAREIQKTQEEEGTQETRVQKIEEMVVEETPGAPVW